VFVLDGGNVVIETRDAVVTAKYVRGVNLLYATIENATRWYLYNGHGDVVQLTSTGGTVVKSYAYDAFGVEVDPEEGDVNPYRYCGEYYDVETGAYYLRARYYDPKRGRFNREDPARDG
jgi:RHS repeat-associated protein